MKIYFSIVFILYFLNNSVAQDTLTNEQVMRMAISNNPILKNLEYNAEIIRSEYYNVNNFFPSYPTIGLDYESDQIFNGSGSYNYELSLGLEVEIGGQSSLRKDIANLRYEKALLIYKDKLFEFENDLKYKLIGINSIALQLKILNAQYEMNESVLEYSQQRLSEGDISELDYNLIQIKLNSTLVEIKKAEKEFRQSILSLSNYLGVDALNIAYIIPDTSTSFLETNIETLKSSAFNNRNDLKLLDYEIKENDSKISLINSEFFPNLDFKFGYGYGKSLISGDKIIGSHSILRIEDLDKSIILGLKISLPLSINGLFSTRDGDVQISNLKKNIATNEKIIKETIIKTELINAFSLYNSSWEELKIMKSNLEIVKNSIELLNTGYRKGELSVINFLNELSKLFDYQLDYLNSFEKFKLSEIELEKVTQTKLK